MNGRDIILDGLLCLLDLLWRFDALQFTPLEELKGFNVCITATALVTPRLTHEARVRVAADPEGPLELANFHFAGTEEGSDFAADLIAGIGDVAQTVVIAVDFVDFVSLAFGGLRR